MKVINFFNGVISSINGLVFSRSDYPVAEFIKVHWFVTLSVGQGYVTKIRCKLMF